MLSPTRIGPSHEKFSERSRPTSGLKVSLASAEEMERLTADDGLAKAYLALSRLLGEGDDSAVVVLSAAEEQAGERIRLQGQARERVDARGRLHALFGVGEELERPRDVTAEKLGERVVFHANQREQQRDGQELRAPPALDDDLRERRLGEVGARLRVHDARVLGDDDEYGSVEEGKLAELVVLAGDPVAEPAAIREVRYVFRDGYGYDSEKLLESVAGVVGIR